MGNSKIVPINKKDLREKTGGADQYDFEGNAKKFAEYLHDPVQEHKIFTELGFSWHDDDEFCFACDRNGSCPDHPGDNGRYLKYSLNLYLHL